MRDYSKVNGQFWTGKTGKALRGDAQAQLVALYLVTSPHSNMIGVFHCPVLYIAHETGNATEDSVPLAWKKVGGFLAIANLPDDERRLHYIKGILRNRLSYVPYDVIRHLQDALTAGVSVDAMQLEAKNARNWTEFRAWLYDVMDDSNV